MKRHDRSWDERIRAYMKVERPAEIIRLIEQYREDQVGGVNYQVWNVETDARRYWVILPPIRYYPQDDFPSLEFVLTFHVGSSLRLLEAQSTRDAPTDEAYDRAAETWRRLEQARRDLIDADEVEDFQAVGMKLREVLVTLAHEFAESGIGADLGERPKKSDFKSWADEVAQDFAPGEGGAATRAYLKRLSEAAWNLVSALTHARSASRARAEIAVEATAHVLVVLVEAWANALREAPPRCPRCASYRLSTEHRPDLDENEPYITYCESCGWRDTTAEDAAFDTEEWYRCDACGRLHPVSDLVVAYKEDPLRAPTVVERAREKLFRRR